MDFVKYKKQHTAKLEINKEMRKTNKFNEKENKNRRKQAFTAIALTLMLSAAILCAIPLTTAHVPAWTVPTWTYASVSPPIIGVNQKALIVFWSNWVPPTVPEDSTYGDRWKFNIDVTRPDGTKTTLGPYASDPVGGAYAEFTPTQTGTYTFVAKFPDQILTGLPTATGIPSNNAYVNDTFAASASNPVTLKVQAEQIMGWQEAPLPTQYWTRPVNAMNRDWWQLTGNWLAGAAQQYGPTTGYGYGPAPESAHIMWTKPYYAGGIMDYRTGDIGYHTYHYQGLEFAPPIILDGKLYYEYRTNAHQYMGYLCVDLYTGETLYFENSTTPSFAQIYNYESRNQHGGFPYLWRTSGVVTPPNTTSTTTWEMIDGFTGQAITQIANVSSGGTAVYGKDGSILRYSISGTGANKRLLVWNSSQIPTLLGGTSGTNFYTWRPAVYGGSRQSDRGQYPMFVHDGRNGFSLNVSIPDVQGTIMAVRQDLYVIGGTGGKNNGTYVLKGNLWALNLDRAKGAMGSLLWNITFTPPQTNDALVAGAATTSGGVAIGTVDPEDGVFLFENRGTLERWGYSLQTGLPLWGPTPPEPDLNYYGMTDYIYEGKLLTCGYAGVLIALNVTTGKQLWNFTATTEGFESPYGNYPMSIGAIADGKIYIGTGEHSPTQPIYRGSVLQCIDASNGALLWNFPVYGVSMPSGNAGYNFAIADGYLVALNAYDNQLYCFGKGPSATTVSAPQTVIPQGSSVMITGTVTDQTPSSEAKDKPAISDADQSAWMKYLYAQQPMPKNAKGVEVSLDTYDPNGNYVHIATVTSDVSGMFKKMWTPEVPGEYTVIATFAGTNSYYGSSAETAVGVSKPVSPVVTPTPTATQPPVTPVSPTPIQTPISPSPTQAVTPPTSAEPTTTYIAIGVAVVVIVAVAAALMLRRRK